MNNDPFYENEQADVVTLQLAPPPNAEQEKDFYFTFGCGQANAGCYVKIRGSFNSAREEMFRRYGPKWCWQYDSADAAGVSRFGLKEVA
jgi:hypothetical protein